VKIENCESGNYMKIILSRNDLWILFFWKKYALYEI